MTADEALKFLRERLLPANSETVMEYDVLVQRAQFNVALTTLERTLDGYRQTVGAKR